MDANAQDTEVIPVTLLDFWSFSRSTMVPSLDRTSHARVV